MDDILSTWLSTSKGRDFLLVIACRISGVHGWKGKHRPISYRRNGSTVVIEFDEAERLTILDAMNVDLDSNGVLIIGDASEVRFTWPSHDNFHGADSFGEEVFQKNGGILFFSRTGDPFNTNCAILFGSGQLVTLRPIKTDQKKRGIE